MRNWDDRQIGWHVVASFPSFQQAQQAVDALAGAPIPIRQVMIVASGLRPLEQQGGWPGYGWAALHGLLLGAPIAAILGFLLPVAALGEPLAAGLTVAAWAALAGGVAGVLTGVGVEMLRIPRRSVTHGVLHADRYDLVAEAAVADRAGRLLDRLGGGGQGGR